MSSSRRLAALVVALAFVAGGCGAEQRVVAPSDVAAPPSAEGYAAQVRKAADAMATFRREADAIVPATLDDRAARLATARERFATALGEAASATAPAALAVPDRRLIAAWRDADRAMREVVDAARADDPDRFDAARATLARTASRVVRIADAFDAV